MFKSKFSLRSKLTQLLTFCSHKIPQKKVRCHGRYRENVPSNFFRPNDTHALKFLWRKSRHEVVSDYKMLVHIFGKLDSPFCANWTLRKVPGMVDKSLKREVADHFYMDDFLSSLSDEESLIRLFD